ncbi:hypothetical protein EMIHUDRAFT_210280 [Emiliania huxleyi CCMP1516]|uniref:RRM domain-containing protein n=2 Tax=Emiliania huxleyi TaxID=2903 RepID=A0A0D3IZS6_EMIH1|nr:hypothetical protein EMIHUDRAFT_210280 [Emiliania huxleyi CCMP1516]EOD16761.1 hypothetical protein EMIHUDRAFT_210280 [Emiliania huxleyi CCMP1516]|eukprot:XP_005769190.1 hypothetical protein EMIHUDRAFT_210280 [Emiliania huxleyi CCMP1516]
MWDVDSSGQEVAPPANTAAGAAGSALPNAMARMQETAMMTALLQQQAALTRRARRLHIGNLPPGLTLESMRELFNTTLSAAKLTLDEAPCINDVHMSGDARFGFVEFRSVLECTNALVLDGMQLLGRALKVQRPNDYMPPPPGLDKVLIPQSVSSVVTSVHVGNLPLGAGLTAEMLKQFFNAAITSANLHDSSKEGDPVIDSMIGSEGKFGFIEFRTIAEARYGEIWGDATSCIALNNIELAGKQLRIERPRDYAPMPDSMLDELRAAGEDLASAEEMGEILEDARSECSKHGAVSLYVPKPGVSGPAGSGAEEAAIALKLFAEYGTAAEALACGKELHGKQFDGRTVLASFLPPEAFQAVKGLDCFTA